MSARPWPETSKNSSDNFEMKMKSRDSSDALKADSVHSEKQQGAPKRDLRFWLVFFAMCVSLFLSALEQSAVSTALPTIIHDLQAVDFVWVASAYALAMTAFLPISGGLAQIFGRKPLMIISLVIFALGSALCGAAKTMSWLIAARTVQGLGGGGILAITSIILSDLVPLEQRGAFQGLFALTWSIAGGIGPVVGGALADDGQWRWLFYLNLPICGVSILLVLAFLNVRTPPGSLREKFSLIDWIGNFLIIGSASATVIAITWGGVRFNWSDARVLVPLIVGLVGIMGFLLWEGTLAKRPIVPFRLLNNRTSLSGYLQTFFAPILALSTVYYMPVYFQACKGASPTASGVDCFGLAFAVCPGSLLTGTSVTIFKKYRLQCWLGWPIAIIGLGLLSTIKADTSRAAAIGYQVVAGWGIGMMYAVTYFPVLAPLKAEDFAYALAFFAFLRSFAGVWGVTIGSTVLQNELKNRLPADFLSQLPEGIEIAYAIIPQISSIPEPLKTQVRVAFAESLAVIWRVMIGIAGAGLLSSIFMKKLPLHTQTDERWGMIEKEGENDMLPPQAGRV